MDLTCLEKATAGAGGRVPPCHRLLLRVKRLSVQIYTYQRSPCILVTHLVIARHSYKVEQVVNLLKGAATRRLIETGLHPLADFAKPGERPPRMWAEHEWKVFLDSEEAIENAINYVMENPTKEEKPPQHWSFVTPFAGLDAGWIT